MFGVAGVNSDAEEVIVVVVFSLSGDTSAGDED